MDLAVVLEEAGRHEEADAALAEALELAQAKGDAATAAQITQRRARYAEAPRS